MDIQALATLVSTLGFPIFMCIVLVKYIERRDERHQQEMDKITEAVTNNTVAILNLSKTIDRLNKEK